MAWTLVQGFASQATSGTNTASYTLSSAVANGSVVGGFFFWTNGTNTDIVNSITDDKSNTYTKIQYLGKNPTQVYNIVTF
jgi:hypothetical protein